MPWAASVAQAQSSPAAFAPLPPAFIPLAVTVSASAICEGGRAVLAASGGGYKGTAVTYDWTPNTSISALTGSTAVVGPLQTTTYTVTGCER